MELADQLARATDRMLRLILPGMVLAAGAFLDSSVRFATFLTVGVLLGPFLYAVTRAHARVQRPRWRLPRWILFGPYDRLMDQTIRAFLGRETDNRLRDFYRFQEALRGYWQLRENRSSRESDLYWFLTASWLGALIALLVRAILFCDPGHRFAEECPILLAFLLFGLFLRFSAGRILRQVFELDMLAIESLPDPDAAA